jgi:hypothetical protein
MKFRLIGAEKAQHPVSLLCGVLRASRSGFHAWLPRQPSKRWVAYVRLLELIHGIHRERDGSYGSPRIDAGLRARGVRVARQARRAADAPPLALRGRQATLAKSQASPELGARRRYAQERSVERRVERMLTAALEARPPDLRALLASVGGDVTRCACRRIGAVQPERSLTGRMPAGERGLRRPGRPTPEAVALAGSTCDRSTRRIP